MGTIVWKKANTFYKHDCLVWDPEGVSTTLTAQDNNTVMKIIEKTKKGYDTAEDGDFVSLAYPNSETRRGRVGHGVAQTLLTEKEGAVVEQNRIRKLTPREYWRLMDFDDEDFDRASQVVSRSQLYKQAGNSIVVNCMVAIFGQLYEGKEEVYKER